MLDKLSCPNDLKKIDLAQLEVLCAEIRADMIEHVSNNGGHLASNLGIVEITVALLRTFDFNIDKIIWDVGHQCYPYKILTGRREQFPNIRKRGGLSGFPKREESSYDFFNTGHSSTSVSAALGYVRAAKLTGAGGHSIAVIGDGAMTGGMAFEAINDAGAAKDKLIVLLNDNEMSISKNVGGFSEYFSKMRASKLYSKANVKVRTKVEKLPLLGKFISKKTHQIKGAIKYLISQNMLFEEMGFHYIGPVDGHDIKKLENIISKAKTIDGPVLIHAITMKGKGYKLAERDPENYHGVPVFDSQEGISTPEKISFSETFGKNMEQIVKNNSAVSVICPAVGPGCGLKEFSEKFPQNYYDVGIAEQHAVTLAAGMACGGAKPVIAGYSSFMQRAYDQILHDVCLMNLDVVLCLDRAGLTSSDGETHQGIYDLSYLGHMPNLKIYAPANFTQLENILNHALYEIEGPVVIRYPKGDRAISEEVNLSIAKKCELVRHGSDCIIFAYGRMLEYAISAAEILEKNSISCAVVNMFCLKPIDFECVLDIAKQKRLAYFIEDVVEDGSVSQKISSYLQKTSNNINFIFKTLPEQFDASGKSEEILESLGMSAQQIADKILGCLDNI